VSRQRLIDFHAGPDHRCHALLFREMSFAVMSSWRCTLTGLRFWLMLLSPARRCGGQVWMVRLKIADVFP
ncbi:hypothetical protein, partial [Citrobacter sedlakii]